MLSQKFSQDLNIFLSITKRQILKKKRGKIKIHGAMVYMRFKKGLIHVALRRFIHHVQFQTAWGNNLVGLGSCRHIQIP